MNRKTFIWGGLFIGTTVGGAAPLLWGGTMFSMSAVVFNAIGGLVGIWIGFKLAGLLGI